MTNYATADPAAALRTALFRARVPPLGHALYTFAATADETVEQPAEAPEYTAAATAAGPAAAAAGSAVTIENEALSLTFDATGALASITNKAAKLTTPLTQAFSYCRGSMSDGGCNPARYEAPGLRILQAPLKPTRSGTLSLNSHQVFGYYKASEGSKASGGGGQGSGGHGQASATCLLRP